MHRKIRFTAFVILFTFALSACATQHKGHDAQKSAQKRYKNHPAADCGCKH
ncbi:MAG: hypothetical protein LBU90_09275 [Bacteroidales bacterium]|jgi:predicted small secreted protein|nr:hypothetical protein [Bacteroidales bacterium]